MIKKLMLEDMKCSKNIRAREIILHTHVHVRCTIILERAEHLAIDLQFINTIIKVVEEIINLHSKLN